jgi:mycothiol synthase
MAVTTSSATDGISIDVAGAPAIDGVQFRRLRDRDDYAPFAALLVAGDAADGLDYAPDAANLAVDYQNYPGLDPSRDVLFAELDGQIVAYAEGARQVRDGMTLYAIDGMVHPAWRRRGLGRALLRHVEAYQRDRAPDHDDPGGRELHLWAPDRPAARRLLESEGYRVVRHGFRMRRPVAGDLPDLALPNGVEMRVVDEGQYRQIFAATNEAFEDHWGHREQTEADFRRIFDSPDLDTALWSVAWHGDQVVGSVQTAIWAEENRLLGISRAWMERISVRRAWRGLGIAKALIVDNLRRLQRAGIEEALLGVDAQNPTGALQLYEGLGFEVRDSAQAHRKAM